MLTIAQKEIVERLIPMAEVIARRMSSDDEAMGIARAELCEAVHRYDPTHDTLTVEQYTTLAIQNKLLHWRRRNRFEHSLGTVGGAPSQHHYETHSPNGRRVRRTHRADLRANNRRMEDLVADPSQDNTEEVRWREVIESLPKRLRPIAFARWVERRTVMEVATALSLTRSEAHRKIQEAESFAILLLTGGR